MTRLKLWGFAGVSLAQIFAAGCSGDDSAASDRGLSGMVPGAVPGDPANPVAGGGAGGVVPGTPGAPVTPAPVAAGCAAESFASPLQLLNEFELQNTVRDLFGRAVTPEVSVPQGARGAYRGALLIEQLPRRWEETAWAIAAEVTSDVAGLTGCDAANQTDACAQTFIQNFAAKVYRRPSEAGEIEKLVALFQDGKTEGFAAGIEMVVAASLQHPMFTYRAEAGIPASVTGEPTLRRLTGYEVASRLSYNLWGTMPDAALFAAAASGELDAPAGVRSHADRMLLDPRATPMFADFIGQWLFLDHLGSVPKDATVFPAYTNETTTLLKQEIQLFVQGLFQNAGDLNALFTADYGFLNEKLAAFYGVPGVTGEGFVKTAMPPAAQRAGLMTFAGLLSVEGTIQGVSLAGSKRSYPIGRGRFIRERLACESVPSPLANATDLPEVKPLIEALNAEYGDTSQVPPRAFFQRVTSQVGTCAACHTYLEPLGFVLERFGADGLPRANDIDGMPAIQAGTYAALGPSSPELVGELASPAALGAKLAQSESVRQCLTSNWAQYSLGRNLETQDVACLGVPTAAADVGATKLKDIYLDFVASDLYRVRRFD